MILARTQPANFVVTPAPQSAYDLLNGALPYIQQLLPERYEQAVGQGLLLRNAINQTQLAGRLDASANALKPGEMVTPLTGTDLDGKPYQVQYARDGKKQLLMFFSPSCQYCVKQGPIWRDLLDRIDANRFNVVGIVGDREDKQEVTQHADGLGYFKTRVALPVVAVNTDTLVRYKLTATPTTLLIDDSGRVEHAWVGMWDDAKMAEVAAALK